MSVLETQTKYKTCLVQFVQPGICDKVLRVFPAEHENEKIDLGNQNGIQRYEKFMRVVDQYTTRDQAVPKAVPYATDENTYSSPAKALSEIPLVQLTNYVWPKPPEMERVKYNTVEDYKSKAQDERFLKIEAQVDALAQGMNRLIDVIRGSMEKVPATPNQTGLAVQAPQPEPELKRGPGRPRKE